MTSGRGPGATIVAAGLVLLALVTLVGVQLLSGRRAENRCTDRADQLGYTSITQSWSWSPLGTRCTFDGRVSETRLLW